MSFRENILQIAIGSQMDIEKNLLWAEQQGILEEWFPGFSKLRNCFHDGRSHLEGNGEVLIHVAKVFANCAQNRTLSASEFVVLLSAALLHDIEKPACRTEEQVEGRKVVRFLEHEVRGAERAIQDCVRLGLNSDEANQVEWLVRQHMLAHRIPELSEAKRRPLYEHQCFHLLVLLQEADARCTWLNADGSEHVPVYGEYFKTDRERIRNADELNALKRSLLKKVNERLAARGIPAGPYWGQVGNALWSSPERAAVVEDSALDSWLERYLSNSPPA